MSVVGNGRAAMVGGWVGIIGGRGMGGNNWVGIIGGERMGGHNWLSTGRHDYLEGMGAGIIVSVERGRELLGRRHGHRQALLEREQSKELLMADLVNLRPFEYLSPNP